MIVDNRSDKFKTEFKNDAIQWHDIADVTLQLIKFVQFIDATLDEKKQVAKDK